MTSELLEFCNGSSANADHFGVISQRLLSLAFINVPQSCLNKLCGRPPQYAPAPYKLAFDLLTLKVVRVRVTCDVDYLCYFLSVC